MANGFEVFERRVEKGDDITLADGVVGPERSSPLSIALGVLSIAVQQDSRRYQQPPGQLWNWYSHVVVA